MNLPELLKNLPKAPFTQQEILNLSHFLQANAKRVDFYRVSDWGGDTYVILKWPHKVPGLTVLP